MNNESKGLAQQAEEKLASFNYAENFVYDIENRLLAIMVDILKKEGPVVALSYRTLEKYTEEEAIKEMEVSEEDLTMFNDGLKRKLFLVYVFNKAIKNTVIPFKDVKVMEVNSDFLKGKVIASEDDFKSYRVVFKLLDKRPMS